MTDTRPDHGGADAPPEPAGRQPEPARPHSRFQCLQLAPGIFRWRLTVGNGRTLGRGTERFPTVRAVLDDIAHLHRVARHGRLVVTYPGAGVGWRLVVGDLPVAESAHSYGRTVEARRAADRFLAECTHALVDPAIAVAPQRPLDRRRLR